MDHIIAQEEADFREQVEAQELQRADNYMDVLEGPHTKNYVQVITDTPSVNAKAWTLVEEKVPHLLANPCIFHCVNLYFTHIVKGDKSDRANPKARTLTLSLTLTLTLDLTLHVDLVVDVTLDLTLDVALDLDVDRDVVLDLDVTLDVTLDLTLDLTLDVTVDVDVVVDRTLDVTLDVTLHLTLGLTLDLTRRHRWMYAWKPRHGRKSLSNGSRTRKCLALGYWMLVATCSTTKALGD